MAKANRRNRMFIDSALQGRFIAKQLLFTTMALLFSIGIFCSIYTYSRHLIYQPDPFTPGGSVQLYNLPALATVLERHWEWILLGVGTILATNALFSLIVSFRFAGPVHRMRGVMAEMRAGDFRNDPAMLRKGDALRPLYDDLLALRLQWKGVMERISAICCDEERDPTAGLAAVRELIADYRLTKEVDGER